MTQNVENVENVKCCITHSREKQYWMATIKLTI